MLLIRNPVLKNITKVTGGDFEFVVIRQQRTKREMPKAKKSTKPTFA